MRASRRLTGAPAGFAQEVCDIGVLGLQRPVDGGRTALVGNVRIGIVLQQQLDHFEVPVARGKQQRR